MENNNETREILIKNGNECYNEALRLYRDYDFYSALENAKNAKEFCEKANSYDDIKDAKGLIKNISNDIREIEIKEQAEKEADKEYEKGLDYYRREWCEEA